MNLEENENNNKRIKIMQNYSHATNIEQDKHEQVKEKEENRKIEEEREEREE